jgi:hypothetical protein
MATERAKIRLCEAIMQNRIEELGTLINTDRH